MPMINTPSWFTTTVLAVSMMTPMGCDAPEDVEELDLVTRSAPKANDPPDPFTTFAVFIADGVVPPGVSPALNGDLSFFFDVMDWDQATFDAWKAEKLLVAETRWGIPDPENNPNVSLQIGTTNPILDYRVVTFSDRRVPTTGWKNREGFINLVVTNPAGLTLGGVFNGLTVPAGTIVGGGGIYNIEVTNKQGVPTGEEIVIDFDTQEPLLLLPAGFAFGFFCAVDSDDFGDGLAQGITALVPQPDGSLKTNVRNVVTFSDQGGL